MTKYPIFVIWIIYFFSLMTMHLAEKPYVYDFGLLLNVLSFLAYAIYTEKVENNARTIFDNKSKV